MPEEGDPLPLEFDAEADPDHEVLPLPPGGALQLEDQLAELLDDPEEHPHPDPEAGGDVHVDDSHSQSPHGTDTGRAEGPCCA